MNYDAFKYPPEYALEVMNIVMKQVELMCANEADDLTYDGLLNVRAAADGSESYFERV